MLPLSLLFARLLKQGNRMNANVVDGGKALKILVDDQGVTDGLFTGL